MPDLIVENMTVTFPGPRGKVDVVRDFSVTIGAERVGLVGESGSGKSMTARALLGLVRPPGNVSAGRFTFGDKNLLKASKRDWINVRGRGIAMVIQDPNYSLNPVQKVGEQVAEAGLLHGIFTRSEARDKAVEMLRSVGISDPHRVFDAYPHQLSGGLGQRAMIAAMLIASPQVLIADEPTSALDVQVRDQVLDLISREILQRQMGLLLISHDLRMVARYCDRVLIMYKGQIVESCTGDRLFEAKHPYTRGLLGCLPSVATRGTTLPTLDRASLEGHLNVSTLRT